MASKDHRRSCCVSGVQHFKHPEALYTVLTIEKPVLVPCMPLLCGRSDEDIPMALGVTVLGLRMIGIWGLLSRAGFDDPTICNGGVDVYSLQYRVHTVHARCCS